MAGKKKRVAIHEMTKGHCWYCGQSILLAEMCVDHVYPKFRGGNSNIDNLLPACRSCNCSKRDRTIEEYREYLQWKRLNVEPFTNAQIIYLRTLGFEFPPLPPLVFWGEKPS